MKIDPVFRDPRSVLVIRTAVDDPPSYEEFRRAGVTALEMLRFELEGEKVVVKPNVTIGEEIGNPESGITTHPGFVHGLVDYCALHGVRRGGTYIVEDPRNNDSNAPRDWHHTGYPEVAAITGAKLRTPTGYTCVNRPVPGALVRPVLPVSRLATSSGVVLINAPKLKTHNLAITTLCLKNLMGLVNGVDRHYCGKAFGELPEAEANRDRPKREWMTREIHERWQAGLSRRLIDTARVVSPSLNVVEGIVGREGTGFQRGRNRVIGLVVAGINMVAVDSVTSYLMGFDPERIVYLKLAAEAGLGTNRISDLELYTIESRGGTRERCGDIGALRVELPFRVISDIVGEEPVPF